MNRPRYNHRIVVFKNNAGKEIDTIEYNDPMTIEDREKLKSFLFWNYRFTPDGKAEVTKCYIEK